MTKQRFDLVSGLGMAGLASGVLAAVTGRRKLAVVSAAAAGIAGAVATRSQADVHGLESQVDTLTEQIRQLESAVAAQVQSRMAAEEAVKSLSTQLASAEKRSGVASPVPIVISESGVTGEGLTDTATGLFNHEYFLVSLDSRISAARRHLRPVAVAILQVVDGREGTDRPDAEPMVVANALRETLRDSDTATRLHDGRYGVVLEDTPENGAIWTMERIRRCLAQEHPNLTLWAGVACYPAHAFDVGALIERAEAALEAARDWHQDRIEVATAE